MGLVQQCDPGRTTLLGTVNVLLTNIGEQPSRLDNEQIQDARVAQQTLLEFHKDGQTPWLELEHREGLSLRPRPCDRWG